ncbi:DUF1822 family protein [Merismopedia glauca]|uniref:DUF1822 domain-containing protein n=1 Tax=Merismopedia glauca CCAP 1448/3 TaxID=1296344 RepID=A0A2T1BZ09_9CYAN|nr:DUF1822 family protein [Merismopedia glauca]PSB01103.1 hypothetical protein C7B64_20000 [Merismopedia glauca CCAP 1448/3]
MNIQLTKPTDLCLEISPEILQQAEEQSQHFSSSRRRAYLNLLCLKTFLPWLQEMYPNEVHLQTDEVTLNQFWEVVNGTPIILGTSRLILIPSSAIDTEELRVEREWIDIPNLIADYYLAVQVDESDRMVRIWGYTTHKHLKEKGNYSDRDRSYYLDRQELISDLNVLSVVRQLCLDEPTRSEVISLPALPLDRANQLLEYLGNPQTIFPRRLVPFSEWGALLANENLRRILYQKRVETSPIKSTSKPVNLQQWLQGVFEAGWKPPEELINPQLLLGFRPIEVKRGKIIDILINSGNQKIVLIVKISQISEAEIGILAQIYPDDNSTYLPPHLQLIILDENGEVFQEIIARSQDKLIQYEFEGNLGEEFAIKVALEDTSVIEKFIIG